MELQTGLALLIQQHNALFMKNLILSLRHKRSIILRIFSSIFFLLIMLWAKDGMQKDSQDSPWAHNITDPKPFMISPPIPPCEDKFFMKPPCFDFVWSGNNSARIRSVVSGIMANNPGRPIPSHKVKSFKTPSEVDAWLFADPMHCAGALHFFENNDTVISYGIQTNSTTTRKRGKYEDQTFKFQIPLQIAAEREIARILLGDPNLSWVVGLKEFARPALETDTGVDNGNVMSLFGPVFFLALSMFSFVFQISSLVTEKELKLRQAMSIMGLYDTAYWLSWIMWEGIILLLSSLVTVLFGMMLQFEFFLNNSFAILFLVFYLFQFSMMAFAFTLSAFIRKSSSSTTAGFSIFIISFVTSIAIQFGFPYSIMFAKKYRIMWSFFPPHPFFQALNILSSATQNPEDKGISWSKRAECPGGDQSCVITINDIFIWLVSTFFLWLVLAIYLDNVIPNAAGVRKSIFYFLNPGYWTGKDRKKLDESCCISGSDLELDHTSPDDKDVHEEESIVKKQTRKGVIDPNVAVQIRGLRKSYRGTIKISFNRRSCCFCCCRCSFKIKKIPSYQAVKGLWLNFAKDQLFCLLGPNGAGKTTTISCLTGITPVTRGDALIYGNSIRSNSGMSSIRRMIGVCPQFDILWDTLSGQEHLRLFASIKGLAPSSIESVAEKLLADVKLSNAATVRAGSYSGGMKRRLSVAIALIGDPKLLILDEPTTGMDPVTRRHVWDVIEDAKKGRAIVLTTHSMEEADILSDRIGIMAKGRLRCIGTSIRLKSRFGTGFLATVSFSESTNRDKDHEAVKKLFKNRLSVVPKEGNKSLMKFVIPHDKEGVLTNFFAELQSRQREFGIKDIQLSLTTLEEVFLNIAKAAELEAALAEGNLTTLALSSGASIEIPIGARFVGIPGTDTNENPKGVMVEVYWEQNDSGALCISGHSPETPVPPHAKLKDSPTSASPETLGKGEQVHGILIDL